MTAPDALRARVAELISAACDHEVSAETIASATAPLSALGIGSLARVRLIDALEDEVGFALESDEVYYRFEDLDSLTAWLAAAQKAGLR